MNQPEKNIESHPNASWATRFRTLKYRDQELIEIEYEKCDNNNNNQINQFPIFILEEVF